MEVIFNISGNVLVAELLGELDHHAASRIREDIDQAMANYTARDLVFDFSKVTYMDSSGIGMVLGRYRRISAEGGQVAIVACSKIVRHILNMAGVFGLITYMDTKEEAVAYFRRKEVS